MRSLFAVAAVLFLSLSLLTSCGPSRTNDGLPPSGNLADRINANGGLGGAGSTAPVTSNPTGTATLFISPATLPNGMIGNAYSTTMTVSGTGASNPITWAVGGGTTLPPGLTLSGSTTLTETLAGQPTTAGTYTFTITAASTPTGATGQTSYTVVVQ